MANCGLIGDYLENNKDITVKNEKVVSDTGNTSKTGDNNYTTDYNNNDVLNNDLINSLPVSIDNNDIFNQLRNYIQSQDSNTGTDISNNSPVDVTNPEEENTIVNAWGSYKLDDNQTGLIVRGECLVGTGNDYANAIMANNYNDTLIGGKGDDTYTVFTPETVIIEKADGGIDSVEAGTSYSLSANIENLTLLGETEYTAIGNDMDNTITGNCANNLLIGMAGDDTYIFNENSGKDIIDDNSGLNTIEFNDIEKENIAIFKQGNELIIDDGFIAGNNQVTVANSVDTSEKLQIGTNFLTNTDINQIIENITSYVQSHADISVANVEDVKSNSDLMTMIANSWH